MENKKKSQKKEEEKIDYKDKYLRALADYQNLQKQTAKEKQEFAKYANVNLILEILPIYENLKISLEHLDDRNHDLSAQTNEWMQGIKHVIKQFEDMLNGNGVEVISPEGQEFNPQEHEAVERVETKDKEQVSKVAKVVKQGYMMGDKVIQVAKVAVYSEKN